MKRIHLSEEELQTVVRLHNEGKSWLEIQRLTGIPRRVAQRSYQEWDRKRSSEEFRAVRREVAKGEFEKHLDALTQMADSLVKHLWLPESPAMTVDAERHLLDFFEKDTGSMFISAGKRERSESEKARLIRRRKVLFKALQEHTKGNVYWDRLEKWKKAWDRCKEHLPKLREEAHRVVSDDVKGVPELNQWVASPGAEEIGALEKLSEAVLASVWKGMLTDCFERANSFIHLVFKPAGDTEMSVVMFEEKPMLNLEKKALAEQAVKVCNRSIKALWSCGILKDTEGVVRRVQQAADTLDRSLDPFVLRPLILRTSCEICPI